MTPRTGGASSWPNMIPDVPGDRDDTYQNLEVGRATSRLGDVVANTSLLPTKNHRWLTAIVATPNDERFRLDETWTIVYRLAGGYKLPYGFTVSTLYQVFSGAPGQRTVIFRAADPDKDPSFVYGGRSLPVRHQMNLRLFKTNRARVDSSPDAERGCVQCAEHERGRTAPRGARGRRSDT
jgi:hypothetical protein